MTADLSTLFDRRPRVSAVTVGQVIAFLIFYQSLDLTTHPGNRFFWHWTRLDWLARFLTVTTVGLGIAGVSELVRALWPVAHRRFAGVVGLAACAVVLWSHALHPVNSPAARSLFLGGSLACGVAGLQLLCRLSILGDARHWASGVRWAVLAILPALPIHWLTALTYPVYPAAAPHVQEEARHVPIPSGPAPPDNVYLFVFDAWPHRLTLAGDQISDSMPALQAFARTAAVFHDGHSAGSHTLNSMPRLIFQRQGEIALRSTRVGLWDGERFHATETLPSLFTEARHGGYRSYLVGWYLPYQAILGDQVDDLRVVPYYEVFGPRLRDRMLGFAWDAWLRLTDPRDDRLVDENSTLRNRAMARQTAELLAQTERVLSDPASGQFALFHLSLPHFPFIFDRAGLKPLDERYGIQSVPDMQGQLEYLDGVIGRFMSLLRQHRKYEASTIVLTSDHTWRRDPALRVEDADRWTRVPLFIKFPHQEVRVDVHAPFRLTFLSALLDAVRSDPGQLATLDGLVRAQSMFDEIAPDDNRRWVPLFQR